MASQWIRLGWGVSGIPTEQEREEQVRKAREIVYGRKQRKCECVYTANARRATGFESIELVDPGCTVCGGTGFVSEAN